jgi:hypothetical protein
MKYAQVVEGEWIEPRMTGYKMGCCDCGLVHEIDFKINNGRVLIRARRNNRSTALMRRKNGITVRHPA